MAAVIARITSNSDLTSALADRAATVAGVSGLGAVLTTSAGTTESFWSAGATDKALQDLQLTLGEGPSVDAARHGVLVLEPDLAETPDARWPAFAGAAAELGVCALFAFPLRIGAIGLGVLLLHRDSPGSMSNTQIRDALVLTDALTSRLLRLFVDGEFVVLRNTVHQATGMLAVQLGISLDEALVRLRGHAFGSNRPIDEVAADVVAHRLDLTDSP
ncbi:GAF and ANTAR domain-containing protein [Streptomyces marispadix]|uniref:ANTAR domain-containing protein n=1 Tax=Streptomyces marispadix TaxID=2922868 RepID=A0ABS9SVK1_9ACTN|nr:GAF and ANTAR domain-containing protein [Streptomyces marispadix]MCH6160223.1 ANTAR domain-containing protein [Streptomyces marispadix]